MDLKGLDEVNDTSACTASVKNEWRFTSATSPHALIAYTGINLFLSVCEISGVPRGIWGIQPPPPPRNSEVLTKSKRNAN